MKQELSTLLNKKMDRKDFLKHVAIVIIAVTGFGALIKTLAPAPTTKQAPAVSHNGYGGSVYGGHKVS